MRSGRNTLGVACRAWKGALMGVVVLTLAGIAGCRHDADLERENGGQAQGSAVATEGRTYYVNMKSQQSPYELGRYVGGEADPQGPVLASAQLWAPSAIRTPSGIRLYAARETPRGWTQLVMAHSNDGINFGEIRVVLETDEQLRMPHVVRDHGVYHLWYSEDDGELIGQNLVHATSKDGKDFQIEGRKFSAGSLTTISPSHVFRWNDRWFMLIEGYNADLTRAHPHLLAFRDPSQQRYRYAGRLVVADKPAPKLDASLVCKASNGWRGLFTLYGAHGPRFGWEWTARYRSQRLRGRWRTIGDPMKPALSFANYRQMFSVENPARPRRSAKLNRC